MKAELQYLGFGTSAEAIQSFWVRVAGFGFHWHYHPAYEITYVVNGQGIRMVGDSVDYFKAGDFVFLGSNLPHTWISDDDFNQKPELMEVAVLQFSPTLLPEAWLTMPEMENVRHLLNRSGRGIRFTGEQGDQAAELLQALVDTEGLERLTKLLHLLDYMGSIEQETSLLASHSYTPALGSNTEIRLQAVCQYVHTHFTEIIELRTVAGLANMNVSAFCRFFKKSTGQSLMEYVNDLRIGKACNLLLDGRKLSISQIAFESGFNSQTLFNKCFLKKKKMTPSAFRKIRKD